MKRTTRTVDPYRDTAVIDSRAPRTHQAIISGLAVLALATGWWWLIALMAAQLAIGLTFGRRFCLTCVFYFEVVQPLVGEGSLEDSRPPRFANMIGLVFLAGSTVAYALGFGMLGFGLAAIVAVLAGLAAITGFCTGCEFYKLTFRVRGQRFVACPIPQRPAG